MTNGTPPSFELEKIQKEIWEKAVDTQMHFNEMSVKSRQLGLTFVVAALGLAVVLFSRTEPHLIQISALGFELRTHAAGAIILAAALVLRAVRMLDLNVYHRMLRGAVAFGEDLEENTLKAKVMQTKKGMTQLISFYSRHDSVERTTTGDGFVGIGEVTASDKIVRFYNFCFWSLVVIALIIIASTFSLR